MVKFEHGADVTLLYKILIPSGWQNFLKTGIFTGSPDDLRDGYIHLSSSLQWRETAARHFASQPQLYLLSLPEEKLKQNLRWEASRGGQLFPHFYGPLLTSMVAQVQGLALSNGLHQITDDLNNKEGL